MLGWLEDLDALRSAGIALFLALLQEIKVLSLEQLVATAAVCALAVPLLVEIDARRNNWLHSLQVPQAFLQCSFSIEGGDANRLPPFASVFDTEIGVCCSVRGEGIFGEYLAGEGIAFLFAMVDGDGLILGNGRVVRNFFCLRGDELGHAFQLAESYYFGTVLSRIGEDHGLCCKIASGSEWLSSEVGIVAIGEIVAGRSESVGLCFGEIEGRVDAGDCHAFAALVIGICRHHLL